MACYFLQPAPIHETYIDRCICWDTQKVYCFQSNLWHGIWNVIITIIYNMKYATVIIDTQVLFFFVICMYFYTKYNSHFVLSLFNTRLSLHSSSHLSLMYLIILQGIMTNYGKKTRNSYVRSTTSLLQIEYVRVFKNLFLTGK